MADRMLVVGLGVGLGVGAGVLGATMQSQRHMPSEKVVPLPQKLEPSIGVGEDAGKDVDDGMSSLLSASRLSSSASLLNSDADEGADHDTESDAESSRSVCLAPAKTRKASMTEEVLRPRVPHHHQ